MKAKSHFCIIWCFLVAFIMLSICSRSSFLYPCNDWNDAQSFFTMGKAMMRGQVLYRDLFEQKGPYLYLVYGIASLISYRSFLGVYILEVISLTFCLFFCHRTIHLFCRQQIASILVPFMAFGVCASKSFYWGGSAEEFCIPFLAYGIYVLLKSTKNDIMPSNREMLFVGFCAGVVALIKYTLLGFFFAWIMIYIIRLVCKKKWKECFKACLFFGVGMFIAFLPWLVYFIINRAMYDFYFCYLYANIFLYGGASFSKGIGQKIYELAKILYWLIWDNWMYLLPTIVGMIGFLFWSKIPWILRLQGWFLFGFLFLGIFIGDANLFYYSLPLAIFELYGLVAVGVLIDKGMDKFQFNDKNITAIGSFLGVGICVLGCFYFSGNISAMKKQKQDIFLFRMQEIVCQEEQPTLLNYGCLDAGLYTVTGILPSCRFYHQCNMPYDEMKNAQNEYVREGRIMFVLSRETYPEGIEQHYELVLEDIYEHFGQKVTFYLFRLKDN